MHMRGEGRTVESGGGMERWLVCIGLLRVCMKAACSLAPSTLQLVHACFLPLFLATTGGGGFLPSSSLGLCLYDLEQEVDHRLHCECGDRSIDRGYRGGLIMALRKRVQR